MIPTKVHALIIADIKSKMPMMLGKEQKKKELIEKLDETYKRIQKEYSVPAGKCSEDAHKISDKFLFKFQVIFLKYLA